MAKARGKVSTKIKNADKARDRLTAAATAARASGGTERLYDGALQNHGASPLTRWKAAKELSDSQLAAIGWCQKRWAVIGTEKRTTANYDERTSAANDDGETGAMILRRMGYSDDLKRVAGGNGISGEFEPGYVPREYWQMFENCIRFDEPAGIVGSALGRSAPSVRALIVVRVVADTIAMKERLQF